MTQQQRARGVTAVAAAAAIVASLLGIGAVPAMATRAAAAAASDPIVPSAAQVTAEVAPGEVVEVGVARRDADGGLDITTMPAVGPEATKAVVAEAVRDDATVAVGLPQQVTTLADTAPMATDPYRTENTPFPFPYNQYAMDMLCADPLADASTRYACAGYDWQYATGAGQTVAVIDQGVNTAHPDLASSLLPGARCVGLPATPCQPVTSVAVADRSDHGTHVAGIIAATANNGIGIAGLARDAKIMPVQVIGSSGLGNTTDMAAGVVWAVDNGATVINISLGTLGSVSDPVLDVAVADALRRGVAVVAAAGNDGPTSNRVSYPAAYPGVIGVANVDDTKTVVPSSTRASFVDVAAPGNAVISTVVTASEYGPYGWMTGTSMASPQVAAAVAMLRQRQPYFNPAQLTTLLTSTAEDRGVAGRDDTYGYGIIRPLVALQQSVQPPPPPGEGTTFYPIDPARALDTRQSTPIAAGAARSVAVGREAGTGREIVPLGATAIAYNITVPSPGGPGHLRVMPGDVAYSSASSINFTTSQTIANGLVVKLDSERRIRVYNAAGVPVHAIVDVLGYYLPASQVSPLASDVQVAATGSRFMPIAPVRVYDAALAPALLGPGESREVSVATGIGGQTDVVPVGASGVAYNLTVVEPGAAGHLRVMPGDVAETGASAINWFLPNDKIANGLVVHISENRTVNVYNASPVPVRFLLDVVGYYGPNGALFYPIAPARLYDSRQPLPQFGTIAPLAERVVYAGDGRDAVGTVTSANVIPSGAIAMAYNVTVPISGPSSGGHLRVWPANQSLPNASSINWPSAGATTRANGLTVGLSPDRKVKVYNGSGDATNVIVDGLGYFR